MEYLWLRISKIYCGIHIWHIFYLLFNWYRYPKYIATVIKYRLYHYMTQMMSMHPWLPLSCCTTNTILQTNYTISLMLPQNVTRDGKLFTTVSVVVHLFGVTFSFIATWLNSFFLKSFSRNSNECRFLWKKSTLKLRSSSGLFYRILSHCLRYL